MSNAPNATPGTREVTVQVGVPSQGHQPSPLPSTAVVVIDPQQPPRLPAPVPGQLAGSLPVPTDWGRFVLDPRDAADAAEWSRAVQIRGANDPPSAMLVDVGAADADPSGRLAFEILGNRLVAARLADVLESRSDVLALGEDAQRAQAAAIVDAIPMPELALLPLAVRTRIFEGLGSGGQLARLNAIEALFDSEELIGLWNSAPPGWFSDQAEAWLLRSIVRIEGEDVIDLLAPQTVAGLIDALPPGGLASLSRELRNALLGRLDEAMLAARDASLGMAYNDADRLANLVELPLQSADTAARWLLRDAVAQLPGAHWASLGSERTHALLLAFAFGDEAQGFADGDGDAAPDWVEGLAPPTSLQSRIGDGNGDGLPDAAQATVRTAPLLLDGRAAVGSSVGGQAVFAVLALEGVRTDDPARGAARIAGLEQDPGPDGAPASSVGLLRLAIEGVAPGLDIVASLRLPIALPVSGWWAASASGVWINATGPAAGGSLAGGPGLLLSFTLRDGGSLDVDGQADGHIAGAALLATTEVSLLAHTPDLPAVTGFWF